jgi:hypothetical protein
MSSLFFFLNSCFIIDHFESGDGELVCSTIL